MDSTGGLGGSGRVDRPLDKGEESGDVKKTGKGIGGRQITTAKTENITPQNVKGSASGQKTKNDWKVSAAESNARNQPLDPKQCEFQEKIAEDLLEKNQLSDDLAIYWEGENGEKYQVEPDNGSCPRDLVALYQKTKQELQSNKDEIIQECRSQLAQARENAGNNEGSTGASGAAESRKVNLDVYFDFIASKLNGLPPSTEAVRGDLEESPGDFSATQRQETENKPTAPTASKTSSDEPSINTATSSQKTETEQPVAKNVGEKNGGVTNTLTTGTNGSNNIQLPGVLGSGAGGGAPLLGGVKPTPEEKPQVLPQSDANSEKVKELEAKLQQLEASHQTELNKLKGEVETQKGLVQKTKDEGAAQLTSLRQQLEKAGSELKEARDNGNKALSEKSAELEKVKAELESKLDQLQANKEKNGTDNDESSKLREEIASLTQQLKAVREDFQQEAASIKAEEQDARNKIGELQQELASTKSQHQSDLENVKSELSQAERALAEEKENNLGSIKGLEETIQSLKDELEALKQTGDSKSSETEKNEKELKEKISKLEGELKEQQGKLGETEGKLKEQEALTEEQKKKVQQANSEKEKALGDVKDVKEKAKSEAEKLRDENQRIKDDAEKEAEKLKEEAQRIKDDAEKKANLARERENKKGSGSSDPAHTGDNNSGASTSKSRDDQLVLKEASDGLEVVDSSQTKGEYEATVNKDYEQDLAKLSQAEDTDKARLYAETRQKSESAYKAVKSALNERINGINGEDAKAPENFKTDRAGDIDKLEVINREIKAAKGNYEALLNELVEKGKAVPQNSRDDALVQALKSEIKSCQEKEEKNHRTIDLIEKQLRSTAKDDLGVKGGKSYQEDLEAADKTTEKTGTLGRVLKDVESTANKGKGNKLWSNFETQVLKPVIDIDVEGELKEVNPQIKGQRASRLVQATASALLKQAEEKIQNIPKDASILQRNEQISAIVSEHKEALEKLKTKNWGTNSTGKREDQVSSEAKKHINECVDQAIKALKGPASAGNIEAENIQSVLQNTGHESTIETVSELNDGVETPVQKQIEEINKRLEDPDFCQGVVAAFGSLKKDHKGGSIGGSYRDRSDAAMRMLRENYQFAEALYGPAVLQAVIQDVGKADSKLLPHFQARYGGGETTKDKKTLRSEKVIKQACEYLKEEKNTGPKKPDGSLDNNSARECFKDIAKATKSDNGKDVEGLFSLASTSSKGRSRLNSSGNGLINTFLKDGKAEYVDGSEPRIETGIKIGKDPLVFSGKPLSADIRGSRWSVDPGFLIDDHPDIKVPFEKEDGSARDWVPLKDSQSGKTAIMAMSKAGGNHQPFLYEVDAKNQWRCVPLVSSGNPAEADMEELKGTLFAMSACSNEDDLGALAGRARVLQGRVDKNGNETQKFLKGINGGSNHWCKSKLNPTALQQRIDNASISDSAFSLSDIKGTEDVGQLMETTTLIKPKAFEINAKKLDGASGNYQITDIKDNDRQHFEKFDKPPAYKDMTDHMISCLKEEYSDHGPMLKRIEQIQGEINEYGQEMANPSLHAFKGCVLSTDSHKPVDSQQSALSEVVGKSQRHVSLIYQERMEKQKSIQALLKEGKDFNSDSFEHAVALFEQKKIPDFSDCDDADQKRDQYIQDMASYLQLDCAYQVEHQQLAGKKRLLGKLNNLSDRRQSMDAKSYQAESKKWNLEMALLAEQQLEVNKLPDNYSGESLDSEKLARLSFERRANTVLRANQVGEVNEALQEISNAMSGNAEMKRVSQKGTGWGKSTVVKMLSDHACAELKKLDPDVAEKRSVMIIAPKSNQAEMDITLGRYFRQGGRHYQRLDMSDHIKKGQPWWQGNTLDKVHNTLLGINPNTKVEDRADAIKSMSRAPVGASVDDVQVLMQLKRQLEASKASLGPEDKQALVKLNEISDLFRESMMFCDEWDSAMMPPRMEVLDEVKATVDDALTGVPGYKSGDVKTDNIRSEQASFVFGAKRKHLLSATTGTPYLLMQATGKTDIADAQEAAHLSLKESDYRAIGWMSRADMLVVDNEAKGDPQNEVQSVVDNMIEQHGDQEGFLFEDLRDGAPADGKTIAENLFKASEKSEKGDLNKYKVLFYDDKKHLQKMEKNANGEFVTKAVGEAEEMDLRKSGGKNTIVCMAKRDSVGTDAPQSANTRLMILGMVRDKGGNINGENIQALGRIRKDQIVKKQPITVVMSTGELGKVSGVEGKSKGTIDSAKSGFAEVQKRKSALMNSLGQHPATLKALNSPFSFPEGVADLDKALEIRKEEWRQLPGLDSEQALSDFSDLKRAQYNNDNDMRKVLVEDRARSERSDYAKETEKIIEQASKRAMAEKTVADEQVLMQTEAKKVLDAEGLAKEVSKELGGSGDSFSSSVSEKFINQTNRKLQDLERIIITETGDDALEVAKTTNDVKTQVETELNHVLADLEGEHALDSLIPEDSVKLSDCQAVLDQEIEKQKNDLTEAFQSLKEFVDKEKVKYKKSANGLPVSQADPAMQQALKKLSEMKKRLENSSEPVKDLQEFRGKLAEFLSKLRVEDNTATATTSDGRKKAALKIYSDVMERLSGTVGSGKDKKEYNFTDEEGGGITVKVASDNGTFFVEVNKRRKAGASKNEDNSVKMLETASAKKLNQKKKLFDETNAKHGAAKAVLAKKIKDVKDQLVQKLEGNRKEKERDISSFREAENERNLIMQ